MKFIVNGTFASYAEQILAHKDYYSDYTSGKISQAQFCEAMLADAALENIAGFAQGNIARIAKTPPNEKMPSEKIIGELAARGIMAGCGGNAAVRGGDEESRNLALL